MNSVQLPRVSVIADKQPAWIKVRDPDATEVP
jgi:uncharacterized protein YecT (DUF1311 family)